MIQQHSKQLKNYFVLSLLVASIPTQSFAAVIGVVDSGTDVQHPDFTNKLWFNPGEKLDKVDNDGNGFIDDINGWNFAENNDQLLDRSYLGKFGPDVPKYFDIQAKIIKGTATEEEIAWMKAKQGDEKFTQELQVFGNFMHGTHVAGITAKDSELAKIMGIKLIPTEVKKPFYEGVRNGMKILGLRTFNDAFDYKDILAKMALGYLAQQQSKALEPIGIYLNQGKAQVANCSFGTSYTIAKVLLGDLLKQFYGDDLTDEKLSEMAKHFISEIAKGMAKSFIGTAPKTLYVIAAGNDGVNNDEFPASPANVRADNSITVAATLGHEKLARFSNYGIKMVDVAAPGVAITSAIPGGGYMAVSGTSQATPYVANVAGQVLDANPKLAPVQVKKILMETVDKKEFLSGKVATGGMVNMSRAVYAAKLSTTLSLEQAIADSKVQVADEAAESPSVVETQNAPLLNLAPLFK